MPQSTRIIYIDLLKAFAIFMVLMGHCIQHLSGGIYYEKLGYRLIYSFHMPLFMAMCGMFIGSSKSLGFANFIKKKFKQLLLPSLIFGTFEYIINGGGKSAFVTACYSFWFLKSAFLCCLIYFISKKINSYYIRIPNLGYILSLVACQFSGLFMINIMYPCFIIGSKLNRITSRPIWPLIVNGIIFAILLVFYDQKIWLFNHIYMRRVIPLEFLFMPEFWGTHIYKLITGITGTIFFVCLFKILFTNTHLHSKIYRAISTVGQMTLGIYILQTYILEKQLPTYLNFDNTNPIIVNFLYYPVISILVIALCVGLIKISGIVPFIAQILFNYSPRNESLK